MQEFVHRRDLLRRGGALTGLAALLAACGPDPADVIGEVVVSLTPSVKLPIRELSSDETSFAGPWKEFVDAEMVDLGVAVLKASPESLGHSRSRLLGIPIDATRTERDILFADSCRRDMRLGDLVSVDGWIIPATLAGLAGALSQL